jgi:integrase/recombinase XerD
VVERTAHNRLVPGSIPGEPTKSQVLDELAGLRQLVEMLLGREGRRKLDLRNKSNEELFTLYEAEIFLKNRNIDARKEYTRILSHFKDYLGAFPPSAELAKHYLSTFANLKTTTLYKYAAVVKGFMKWYGEPLDDIKIRVPSPLPDYITSESTDKVKEAMLGVKSHKKKSVRNILILDFATQTGLRCAELSDLKVEHIDFDRRVIIVRKGKEQLDRVVPLLADMVKRLLEFTKGKDKDASLFGLNESTISGIIHRFAVKANVKLHTHSFRYKFATNLNESGVDIRTIQALLGHKDIKTTERYIAINKTALRDAIDKLVPKPIQDNSNPVGLPSGEFDKTAIIRQPVETNTSMDDQIAFRLYEGHQTDLIQFSAAQIDGLEPHLWAFPLRSLGSPGNHSISARKWSINGNYSLLWYIDEKNAVSLKYDPESTLENKTRIIYNYFKQHLQSSSYTWLIEDNEKGIVKLERIGGEELKYRTGLLQQIDREVEKMTGKPLSDPNLMNCAGPSTWFSESIWSAVLDGLYRTLNYEIEAVDGRLFKARYGANFLGLTETKEESKQYIEWHKKLMAMFEKSKTVKAITQLKEDRETVTESIRETLTKFAVDRVVPGKCDYEFCRD